MTDDVGLDPEEIAQLKEILGFDDSRVESFLDEFFPQQRAQEREAQLKAGLTDIEPAQYTVTGEGELWVEFTVGDIRIRMDREPFKRGPGRPRQNPWIDQRMVDRLSDSSVRAACYSVAAYKLKSEGVDYAASIERDVVLKIRKSLFKGSSGLVALAHLNTVAVDALRWYRGNPLPEGARLDSIVLQALIRAIAPIVTQELSRELESDL